MFNSSLRRVARTCPNSTLVTRQTPTNGSIATASFSTRTHQRRYSSSKPPIPPNNGSPAIPASSVKQVGAPRSTDKRPGAESRLSKRKAAKGEKTEISKQQQEPRGNEWTLSLPSVPSTQHLNPKDVYVASFFSTHRPISITGPLPPEVRIDQFDKIFQAQPKRTKKNGSADVIYTLSNVVQNLDEHVQNHQQDPAIEQRSELIKALNQHNTVAQQNQAHQLDGQSQSIRSPGNVKMVIEEIAKRFRPFNTPPPPVPVPELDFNGENQTVETAAEKQAETNEEMQARQLEREIESQDSLPSQRQKHSVGFTAQEQLDIQSGKFFTPRISNISEPKTNQSSGMVDPSSQQPQPSRGGRIRRGVYVDPSNSKGIKYYTISVKRQRKLKMKKHKYKKLMRKTRNIRRRQDKL